jgi:hypothetical protein
MGHRVGEPGPPLVPNHDTRAGNQGFDQHREQARRVVVGIDVADPPRDEHQRRRIRLPERSVRQPDRSVAGELDWAGEHRRSLPPPSDDAPGQLSAPTGPRPCASSKVGFDASRAITWAIGIGTPSSRVGPGRLATRDPSGSCTSQRTAIDAADLKEKTNLPIDRTHDPGP